MEKEIERKTEREKVSLWKRERVREDVGKEEVVGGGVGEGG